MNTPEIVGYEVYNCLVSSTSQMLYYLKEQKKVTTANILSILRGALNYPLEEACYREHIRVHDISFLSSERVFEEEEIAGLEIKYSKLTMVPDSTLTVSYTHLDVYKRQSLVWASCKAEEVLSC